MMKLNPPHSEISAHMEAAGVSLAAIKAFCHSVEVLCSDQSMLIAEDSILPAQGVDDWDTLLHDAPIAAPELVAQSVVIKLNGGLGTSMGLQKAKSLLPIKEGVNFLDIAVKQVQALRQRAGSPVRLLLMNSFSTSVDTMEHLSRYAAEGFGDASEVEMMQNKVPKLSVDTLLPANYPAKPEMAWCPPGHGDLYAALLGSGWLDRLLYQGVKYAFISNSDNLGAQLDLRFLHSFAQSGAPFVMEVTRRTEADKKGGHLATRKTDGRLLLREVAQCAEADSAEFQNIDKHQYFNTNNLWIRLDKLRDLLESHGGLVPLPVIQNKKTIDPRDAESEQVYQLETAMGAAIECFEGAKAVCVPRSRFFPVKTCSDLLLLRSDAVEIAADGAMKLAEECAGVAPVVQLDAKVYKLVDSLDSLGVPSLKNVTKLTVVGEYQFEDSEPLQGEVSFE